MENLEVGQEKEIWRPVVGFDGLYEVSNLGRVKSLERIDPRGCPIHEKIKNQKATGWNEYMCVILYKNGVQRSEFVQRLVAKAFIPNPENKPHVNHINGRNVKDNSVQNLEWITRSENMIHAVKTGLSTHLWGSTKNGKFIAPPCKKGTDVWGAILNDNIVRSIRVEYRNGGISYSELGRRYGVCYAAIRNAINVKTWKHVK